MDAEGVVTAVGNGTTAITVTTVDKGKTATCEITVAQAVTAITISKTKLDLMRGKSVILSVESIVPEKV